MTAERRTAGWHPVFVAAYPVLFLWSSNLEEVPASDVLPPLVSIVGAAILVTLALSVVLGDRARAALIVTPVVLALLTYGHAVDLVPLPGTIHRLGWAALIGLAAFAAWRLSDARLLALDRAVSIVAIVLVGLTLTSIVPFEIQSATAAPAPDVTAARPLATQTAAQKRDVYWLVFDRYPSDRAIKLQFGLDNELTAWLRDHGFQVLTDSHANYLTTALSLATTANLRPLDQLTAGTTPGASFLDRVYDSLQDSLVARQFKALGYRYIHVGSWYGPTRVDRGADVSLNASGASDFSSVLLAKSALPLAFRALGVTEQTFSKNYQHGKYELDRLDGLVNEAGPKFVWAHVLLPHPTYVFDTDGSYIPLAKSKALGEKEAWRRQTAYANRRLEAFLGSLLALPEDRRPIVILQADEGHRFNVAATDEGEDKGSFDWATATPDQLEIKFGILNAWYVPGGGLQLDPRMTAINTFPTLFDGYFGLDYPRLPDRVLTSIGNVNRNVLLDITDRLPSLRG
ncbi:MAG TPA: hypothetical protein VFJ71_01435 [Candidatus Limnocylindrales bacterium]|nr:hypothetical protein [Candidatus Limnocylindrales bacterium]